MALYNVRVTTLDGLSEIVPVHADNISEARRKAESQSEYGSRATGVPTLVAPPPGWTPGSDSFTAMVASVDPNYDPTGGAYSTTPPPTDVYDPTGGAYSTYKPPTIREYDPMGGTGFDIDTTEVDRLEKEERARRDKVRAAGAASLEKFQKKEQERRDEAKEASLVTGPVRSWDAKLGDITINPDGTVNLPTDMWRNASPKTLGRGGEQSVADQPIGREQIEDAIRRIAELGGRDDLNRSVSNMLQQARNYYSSTPRGDNTWDKHIDSTWCRCKSDQSYMGWSCR